MSFASIIVLRATARCGRDTETQEARGRERGDDGDLRGAGCHRDTENALFAKEMFLGQKIVEQERTEQHFHSE